MLGQLFFLITLPDNPCIFKKITVKLSSEISFARGLRVAVQLLCQETQNAPLFLFASFLLQLFYGYQVAKSVHMVFWT